MSSGKHTARCRLLELPAELRERVFRRCLQTASEDSQIARSCPVEPPICVVSRTIREEALPLFYSTYVLPIHTFIRCAYHGQVLLRTDRWYHALALSKLEHVRQYLLRFSLVDRYSGEFVPIEFSLALDKRTDTYHLTHGFPRSWLRNPHRIGDPADFDELVSALRQHLESMLYESIEDPGIGSWTACNLDQLIKVDPDTLLLQTKE